MYAIVETGGSQVKVQEGDSFKIPSIKAQVGEKIVLDKVLMVADDNGYRFGTPYLEKAAVNAEVVSVGKDPKVMVFKFKRRTKYRRLTGHRQPFTEIRIDEIKA